MILIVIQHGVNGGTEGRAGRKSGAQRKKKKKEKKEGKRLARRRKGWPEGRGKSRQAPRPPVANWNCFGILGRSHTPDRETFDGGLTWENMYSMYIILSEGGRTIRYSLYGSATLWPLPLRPLWRPGGGQAGAWA